MTPAPTVAYDANGNTLSDFQGRSFTWDFENRLVQAVVPGTNGGTDLLPVFRTSPSMISASFDRSPLRTATTLNALSNACFAALRTLESVFSP